MGRAAKHTFFSIPSFALSWDVLAAECWRGDMATMIHQPSTAVARSDRIVWPRLVVRPFARLWRRKRDGQRGALRTANRWWVAAVLPFEPQPLPCRGG